MNFGERLANERKRLGYRGADFATACGVTPASQSLYENEKRSPDAIYLQKACKLGADANYLMTGVRAPAPAWQVADNERGPIDAFVGLSPKVRQAMINLVEITRSGADD